MIPIRSIIEQEGIQMKEKKSNKLVWLACLLGLIAVLSVFCPELGTPVNWFSGILTLLGISVTVENVNKSIKNSAELSDNNRSIDLYIKDLREIVNKEKLIVGSDIARVKALDVNDIDFEKLFEMIIDTNLAFSVKQNAIIKYTDNIGSITYIVYGMPSSKKNIFEPLIKKSNKLLLEFYEIDNDYRQNQATMKNTTWLRDNIVQLVDIHEEILDKAKSELNKYYKIDELKK